MKNSKKRCHHCDKMMRAEYAVIHHGEVHCRVCLKRKHKSGWCAKCETVLDQDQFTKSNGVYHELSSYCKPCNAKRNRNNYPPTDETRAALKRSKHDERAAKAGSVPQRWKKSECPETNCYWCGIDLTIPGVQTHLEHLMPIALGGEAKDYNEAPACSWCNRGKWNTHPLVWIAYLLNRP